MQKSYSRFLIFLIVIILLSCYHVYDSGIKYGDIYSGSYHDLMKAANEQDLNKMQEIVTNKYLNLNYADNKEGISLLNWCLINNKTKAFEKLLKLGADPNWQDSMGKMAPSLIEAARNDDSTYLKLCLKYGGKPNLLSKKWQGYEQQTPLFGAVSVGVLYPKENLVNLKLLINAGADVNLSRDSNSSSPLAEALIAEKIEMAKFLIENGADYNNLKFRTSNIALDINSQPIIDSQGSPTIKYGEALNISYFLRQLDFPLNSAKYKTKMEIVNFLYSKGLDYRKSAIPQQVIDNHKEDTAFLSRY